MTSSVIIATYNGEKYIAEQLDSLRTQTRQADEVLIFDDISTDMTVSIISKYIACHNLSNWKLTVNNENKGCTCNFIEGALSASNDVIFYCDQDDIWENNKIEVMMNGFETHQDMVACYCLRTYVTSDNTPMTVRFQWMTNVKKRCRGGFQKVSLEEAVRYNQSSGLTLAARKEIVGELSEMIMSNHLTHDLPIGTVAAIHDGYYVVNQKLVRYRQHGSNLSSPRITVKSRLRKIDTQIKGREGRYNQMTAIYQKYSGLLTAKQTDEMKRAIACTKESIIALKNRDAAKLFMQIFDTNPMMNRWIAVNNWLIMLAGGQIILIYVAHLQKEGEQREFEGQRTGNRQLCS